MKINRRFALWQLLMQILTIGKSGGSGRWAEATMTEWLVSLTNKLILCSHDIFSSLYPLALFNNVGVEVVLSRILYYFLLLLSLF